MKRSFDKALEALHSAAAAIRKMPGIKSCSVDNDKDSGEIIFKIKGGNNYVLRLEELKDDIDGEENYQGGGCDGGTDKKGQ